MVVDYFHFQIVMPQCQLVLIKRCYLSNYLHGEFSTFIYSKNSNQNTCLQWRPTCFSSQFVLQPCKSPIFLDFSDFFRYLSIDSIQLTWILQEYTIAALKVEVAPKLRLDVTLIFNIFSTQKSKSSKIVKMAPNLSSDVFIGDELRFPLQLG